jgi:hypothetical protein
MGPMYAARKTIIGWFIDSDLLAILLSLATGFVLILFAPSYVRAKYVDLHSDIPIIALSLMGFVITAAAIVVSVQDKGMIRLYKEHRPDIWNMTKRVFFLTARVLGFLGAAVLILGDSLLASCPDTRSLVIEKLFLGSMLAVSAFCIIQINKMIYVLSKLMDAALETKLAAEIEKDLSDKGK